MTLLLKYCLALWDEIFDHFPLFEETLRGAWSFAIASSATYSEIRQPFSNSAHKIHRYKYKQIHIFTLRT